MLQRGLFILQRIGGGQELPRHLDYLGRGGQKGARRVARGARPIETRQTRLANTRLLCAVPGCSGLLKTALTLEILRLHRSTARHPKIPHHKRELHTAAQHGTAHYDTHTTAHHHFSSQSTPSSHHNSSHGGSTALARPLHLPLLHWLCALS